MSNVDLLTKKALLAFKPPKKLSLSEWADENAFLSAESSAEGGRWRTLPYQKGIMDAITDPTIEQVTVMKSARVGYSKILNHVIGYHIHQDPAPIMLVQPTIEDAQGYSKEEIAPMLRDTPVLKGLVSEAKAKDGANTILQKQFQAGRLVWWELTHRVASGVLAGGLCCLMRSTAIPRQLVLRVTRSSWASGVLSTTGTGRLFLALLRR